MYKRSNYSRRLTGGSNEFTRAGALILLNVHLNISKYKYYSSLIFEVIKKVNPKIHEIV